MQLNPDSVIPRIMRVFSIYSVFPLKKKCSWSSQSKDILFFMLFSSINLRITYPDLEPMRANSFIQASLSLPWKRVYINQSKNIGMLRHSVMTMHLFRQEFTAWEISLFVRNGDYTEESIKVVSMYTVGTRGPYTHPPFPNWITRMISSISTCRRSITISPRVPSLPYY